MTHTTLTKAIFGISFQHGNGNVQKKKLCCLLETWHLSSSF